MDLEVKDKKYYYIFNGIQPEYRAPEIERYKYLHESLKKLYSALRARHYDVPNINAKFFVDDLSGESLKKYCQLKTIISKDFEFYCFMGSYTSSVHVGKYRTQYDAESDRLNIAKYTGDNWEEDKQHFNKIKLQVEHKIYKSHQPEYYECLKEMSDVVEKMVEYVCSFPTIKKRFSFDLTPDQMVCQELGSYVVFLHKDNMYKLLEDKLQSLLTNMRLIGLSEKTPEGAHEMVHDGFIYAAILTNDDQLDEGTCNMLIRSMSQKYPMMFRPKKADGLYIADATLDPQQIATQMVPFNKYDGSFVEPQIMCHREIMLDELELPLWYYKELSEMISVSKEEWKYNRDDRDIVSSIVKKFS